MLLNVARKLQGFFYFLESLHTFFAGSTYRWSVLTDAIKDGAHLPTVKKLSDTKWSARADAIHAIVNSFHAIKSALIGFTENKIQKPDCRQRARGLVGTNGKVRNWNNDHPLEPNFAKVSDDKCLLAIRCSRSQYSLWSV